MNRLTINLEALRHNYETVRRWVNAHGGSLVVVTKALCGHEDVLRALATFGATKMGDSRLENLRAIRSAAPQIETWYLRPPRPSALPDLLELSDVSLNSELPTIRQINQFLKGTKSRHSVVLMMELGDLREGILPGALLDIASEITSMSNVDLVGVGANLGCLNGTIPMAEELSQLCLYHELLELKFNTKIPYVSAGTSAALGLLREGTLPGSVNQFRVGESILLGTDPVTGQCLPGLQANVASVEAEIVELKEKRLVASGDAANPPFEAIEMDEDPEPGQRGYRAIVTIGHVDTDIAGLTPIDSDVQIAGASSDVTVLNLGEDQNGLRLGDTVTFKPSYSAFVRLMNNPYSQIELAGQAISKACATSEHTKMSNLPAHVV